MDVANTLPGKPTVASGATSSTSFEPLISNRDGAKSSQGDKGDKFGVCPFARFERNLAQPAGARTGSVVRPVAEQRIYRVFKQRTLQGCVPAM